MLTLVAIDDPQAPAALATLQEAAATLRLELVERQVWDESDIERVFASLKPGEVQAVFIAGGTAVTKFPALILRLATERKLPISLHRKDWAERGALFSYGPDYPAMGRDAARLLDRIFRGARPADLPVEQIRKVEFIINLKTAKALRLTIPRPCWRGRTRSSNSGPEGIHRWLLLSDRRRSQREVIRIPPRTASGTGHG